MGRYGFKWCWPPTRCRVYAAHAAVLCALEEGAEPGTIMRRVRELYSLGFDRMSDVAPFRCVICWERAEVGLPRRAEGLRLTLDHVVPRGSPRRAAPGIRNLVSVCQGCNSSRGTRPFQAWLRMKFEAGELHESPEIIWRRVRLVREAPLSPELGQRILQIYYPNTASKLPDRWARYQERRRQREIDLADLPF